MTRTAAAVRWVREAATENVGIKTTALVMALVLFSLVRGAEDATRTMFVEVVALLPAGESGKILISDVPDRVKLTLKGSRALLHSVRREELDALQIDLRDTGRRYYYFDPSTLELPAGVTVEQITPASIPLTWSDRIERRVPVVANLVGELRAGLVLEEPIVAAPARLVLRGPHQEVDPLGRISTEPIDVSDLGPGRHVRVVPIEPLPQHTSASGASAIRVTLGVVEAVEERSLRVPLTVIGAGRVRPTTVEVTVVGPPDAVRNLVAEQVVPTVDAAELPPATPAGNVPVHLRALPERIRLVRIAPDEALLRLR